MPTSPAPKSTSAVAGIATFVLLAALFFVAIYQLQPPAPVPASAAATEFSAERALDQLRVIAVKPHPTGTVENARLRDYLVSQLRALGLDPQIQTATAARYRAKWGGPVVAATVSNVVARLKGTANTRALMLAAHYDSVATGPGASDDGSGTVTLLETARALNAGPTLRNDVIFLFTDGEELGLLGAQAFADEHPWMKDVGLVLNFEARGACGPSFMFETSPENGWLIREFAKAAPHAATSSFAYEAYKHSPNDTDLTVFKGAGLAGLNFAYVGCWPRYHSLRDDLQDIGPASLQHDGSYAVALARHFGGLDLTHTSAPDAVYFSFLGTTVHYPEAWAIPVMVLAIVLFLGVAVLGFRKRQLTWGGIAGSFFTWLAGTAAAAALAHFAWLQLRRASLVNLLPYGMAYNGGLYAYGFIALTVAILSALYVLLGRRIRVANLTFGALTWWALFTVLTSLYLKGASYLFVWPLFASLTELGYAFTRHDPETEEESAFVWTLPAIVGILLFGTLPYLLVELVSTAALAVVVIVTALLLGLLVPHIHIMTAHYRWVLPGAALLAAVVLGVTAMAKSGYDASNPRADDIFYLLDIDTGKADFVSLDRKADAWTSQFLTDRPESFDLGKFVYGWRGAVTAISSSAPALALTPPSLAATDDITIGNTRLLRLRVTSPRRPRTAWISVEGARVYEADINGKRIAIPEGGVANFRLVYVAVPPGGITLTVKVPLGETPVVRVVDESDGLPEIPGKTFRARPNNLMPSPSVPSDCSTMVSKTFRLDVNARLKMPG